MVNKFANIFVSIKTKISNSFNSLILFIKLIWFCEEMATIDRIEKKLDLLLTSINKLDIDKLSPVYPIKNSNLFTQSDDGIIKNTSIKRAPRMFIPNVDTSNMKSSVKVNAKKSRGEDINTALEALSKINK